MKRLFENLFYRTYLVAQTNKYNTHHLDSAIMMFCIPQMLILGGIRFWCKVFGVIVNFERYQVLLFGLAWCFCNGLYFYMYFAGIKQRYTNETSQQKRKGYILWLAYVLSAIIFIFLPFYLSKQYHPIIKSEGSKNR